MPLRVAVDPTVPLVGATLRAAFTVKFVAEVAVLAEASVTVTLWEPLATAGMVKVTVEPVPVALPVALVGLPPVTVAVTPPTFTVSAELAAKPWAMMVALDPTVPLVGVRPVAEAVTVKFDRRGGGVGRGVGHHHALGAVGNRRDGEGDRGTGPGGAASGVGRASSR